MNASELENDFSVLRYDPESGQTKHLHYEEPAFVRIVWEGEPGFLDPDGHYYLDEICGEYDEDPEHGPYRLANEEAYKHQADDTSLDQARGRKHGDTTGARLGIWRHAFTLEDPNWVTVDDAQLYAS